MNNAGVLTHGPVATDDPNKLQLLVDTNMGPFVYLTHQLISGFKKREKRSAVIMTSSVASNNLRPNVATYSASKTFDDCFTLSLEE